MTDLTQLGRARFMISATYIPISPAAISCFDESSERSYLRKSTLAHYQTAVAAAVTINSAIFVVEAIAGYQANSLSLIMDSIHNLSDELALIFIYLAP
jgi:Co/Zn/Cd efflux system component